MKKEEMDLVEGSALSEAKEETTLKQEEPDVGEHRPLQELTSPLVRK
jgi:hypothetical protein